MKANIEPYTLKKHIDWIEKVLCKKQDPFLIDDASITPRDLCRKCRLEPYRRLCDLLNSCIIDYRLIDYLVICNYIRTKHKLDIQSICSYNKLKDIPYLHFNTLKSDMEIIKCNTETNWLEKNNTFYEDFIKKLLYLMTRKDFISPLFFGKMLEKYSVINKENKQMKKYLNVMRYFKINNIVISEANKFLF